MTLIKYHQCYYRLQVLVYFLKYLLGALLVTSGLKSSSRYHEGDDEMGRALSNNTVNLYRGGF
jgi:hypothetical protein